MKKLLLILLCLPMISFGQLGSEFFLKSKSSSSGIFFSPRFGLTSNIIERDYNVKSNFGLCLNYNLSYLPPDFKSEINEDFTFYHSLLLGFSYQLDIIRLRLMSGLIHYRNPNKEILVNYSNGQQLRKNTNSKFTFGTANLIGVSILIKKLKDSYLTINADRFFTLPIKIETTEERELFIVGQNELTTHSITEEVSISTVFLTIGLTKYLGK